jgi:hypothetical protein
MRSRDVLAKSFARRRWTILNDEIQICRCIVDVCEPSGLTVLWEVISNLVLLCSCLGCCYLVERCRKMFDGPSSGHLYVPKLQFTCRWCNMLQNVADVEWCWWCWHAPTNGIPISSRSRQSHSVPQCPAVQFSWLRLASYLHRASPAIQAMRRANISTRPWPTVSLPWIWKVVLCIFHIFWIDVMIYNIYIYNIYYVFTCQCVV